MASVIGKVSLVVPSKQDTHVFVCLYSTQRPSPPGITEILVHKPFYRYQLIKICSGNAHYHFSDLPTTSFYSIFAVSVDNIEDVQSYTHPKIEIGAAVGWFRDRPGTWLKVVEASSDPQRSCDILIQAARSKGFSVKNSSNQCGFLHKLKGVWVLKLTGDHIQRGHAHGELVASEIIDFYEFYVLEMAIKGRFTEDLNFETLQFWNKNVLKPEGYKEELEAIYAGMKSSGVSLFVPTLNRDFNVEDLHVLNSVFEARAARANCTQFAVWGPPTIGSDVDGGVVAGRNMDGEIDVRNVTVTHFLLLLHERRHCTVRGSSRRIISAMWPGFVGTLTGCNENGLYCCQNAGNDAPGPVVGNITPIAWSIREFLSWNGPEQVTPQNAEKYFLQFACAGGGFNASAGLLLIVSGVSVLQKKDPHVFFLECNRFGQGIRLPGDVRPLSKYVIMGSNQFVKYGVTPSPGPDPSQFTVFGKSPSFDSSWRYKSGMETIEAWLRTKKTIGTPQMIQLLQTACPSVTEHSIIMSVTTARGVEVQLAIADPAPERLWDAPYKNWTSFDFEQLTIIEGDYN